MVRRRSENQYSIPMWGYVIGVLVVAWLALGHQFLSLVIEDEVLVWAIYLRGIASWLLLVLFARRAEKAAQHS